MTEIDLSKYMLAELEPVVDNYVSDWDGDFDQRVKESAVAYAMARSVKIPVVPQEFYANESVSSQEFNFALADFVEEQGFEIREPEPSEYFIQLARRFNLSSDVQRVYASLDRQICTGYEDDETGDWVEPVVDINESRFSNEVIALGLIWLAGRISNLDSDDISLSDLSGLYGTHPESISSWVSYLEREGILELSDEVKDKNGVVEHIQTIIQSNDIDTEIYFDACELFYSVDGESYNNKAVACASVLEAVTNSTLPLDVTVEDIAMGTDAGTVERIREKLYQ